jgi:hypothetical protein
MAQVQGKIVQCIGAVVDVEFPRDQMPKVYDALKMDGSSLTLEVQQQLGDGVVRAIATGFVRRFAPRHDRAITPVLASWFQWARPRWAASWMCWAAH